MTETNQFAAIGTAGLGATAIPPKAVIMPTTSSAPSQPLTGTLSPSQGINLLTQWQIRRAEVTRVGQELRKERIAQGLSQRKLAKKAGMCASTISYAERGYTQSLFTFSGIAKALGKHIALV